jgi:hypothetical protein
MGIITRVFNGNSISNYKVMTPEDFVADQFFLSEGFTDSEMEFVSSDHWGMEFTLVVSGYFSGSVIAGESMASIASNTEVAALINEAQVNIAGVGVIEQYSYSNVVSLLDAVYFESSEIGIAHHYRGDDYFYDDGRVDDKVYGYAGNDHFYSTKFGEYEDAFFGGTGIDHLHLVMNRDYYSVEWIDYVYDPRDGTSNTKGLFIRDVTVDGVDNGQVMLNEVERVHFSDVSVAYDIDGHAGSVAKILGAVFGSEFVDNEEYVGIGLSLLDSGTSANDLMALALQIQGFNTNKLLIENLWSNIYGNSIPENAFQHLLGLLQSSEYDATGFALLASETYENAQSINLLGLYTSGVDYLAVG